MKKRIVLVGLCLSACVGALTVPHYLASAAAPQTEATPSPIPVTMTKVQVGDVPIVLNGIGSVEAYNVVDAHSQVTGTIQQIGFVEGQTVHQGSLVAQLDPRPFQAALQQAEANLARDEAHLTNAQVRVDIGNIVQPTSATPIVTFTQIQPISVVFTLPQQSVPEIQAAMAKGTLKVIASDQNDRRRLGEGNRLLVNNMINQASGTAELKATFPNGNRALWPGEFVNAQLVIADRHDGITVPLSALQQGQNGSFVFVVGPDGIVRACNVIVGETLHARALIDHGLQAGDTVVSAGQYRLSDGVKVVSVPAGVPRVQDTSEASAGML
jgi:multidrug efflux system membrane fusion protein